jgi:hypothetical protein
VPEAEVVPEAVVVAAAVAAAVAEAAVVAAAAEAVVAEAEAEVAEAEVAEVAEAEVAEVAGAVAAAAAAFRGMGLEMRSATRSSIQNPPRIGSSRLQAPSRLWPWSIPVRTAAKPGPSGGSLTSRPPGRRSLGPPPAAPPGRATRSTAPEPRARGSRTPRRR